MLKIVTKQRNDRFNSNEQFLRRLRVVSQTTLDLKIRNPQYMCHCENRQKEILHSSRKL